MVRDEKEVFVAAMALLGAEEREAYLQSACACHPELLGRVRALLSAHEASQGPLDRGPVAHGASVDTSRTEGAGALIGRYKLIEAIGEGGMGMVWMAQQTEPVKRLVAVKLIKAGMDSKQIIARFEAERQALALMDHANIARVLDAGTTSGSRPYFVMDLVKGVPITRYCDEQHLTPRQRLELFIPVCQAVQHAHQKGIIHRDLKPSNVLVALYDGKPVPKVIDFGVAKATGQALTDKTLATGFGSIVGTLEYMSPEQAEINQLDVDIRSDIYSLGVILYELLTGSTPFNCKELKKSGMLEILRVIREQEPPKPSTMLSTAVGLPTLAANRSTEPARLRRLVREELDWIVMKALEKDRNRRYETANSLAQDVQRYLDNEPVQACLPSVGYRLRKLVRRQRGLVLTASLVLLALVVGIIGTTWGMLRATHAEADAVSEAKLKSDALTDKGVALADAEEQLFQALVNRARAERGSGRVGQRFEALKAIQAAARIRITPELRTEAMAALVLPDVELAQEWERSTENDFPMHFDASLQHYAQLDRDGGVVVYRVNNGQEQVISRLTVPGTTACWGVVISPDARFVACGDGPRKSITGRVRLWKVAGPEQVMLNPEPPGIHGDTGLVFQPNGRQLAIAHADKSVSIYEPATGRRLHRLTVSAVPNHLAFHPYEHRLAVACGNAVQLFDTDTGKELPVLRHPAAVTHTWYVSWHPDGRRLAAGCNDRKIHLWDTQTATEVMAPWTGHTHDGLAMVFNPTGDRLVSSDWGGAPRLWDVATGRTLLTMPHFGQFSSDNRLFGPTVSGNKIKLWRLAGGQELRVLRPRSAGSLDNIFAPVLHADGHVLAASTHHQLCFFDLASGEELGSIPLPLTDAARPVFFDPICVPPGKSDGESAPTGDRLGGWMTGGQSGLYFWPARQNAARPEVMSVGPPRQITPNPGGGFSDGASASADGRVVAVPQGHSTLLLYRDQPERSVVLGPQHDVRASAVSPDGRWVATCSFEWDGRSQPIRIWDTQTRLPVQDLGQGPMTWAQFSPDGRWLMTYDLTSTRQWEVGSWREVRRFERSGFLFSPDSRLLAISDVPGVIRLLEPITGREVARLTGPEPIGYSPACFTPDGTRLIATSSAQTAVYVWDLRLIRQQLKELGLDWEWPDFPPADPRGHAVTTRKVEVDGGDLTNPVLMHEQKIRQAIDRYRLALKANPDDALACNNLAWMYLTGPQAHRDVKAAQPLAEKAMRLAPDNALYRNTLGVAYYRAGRYREAAETLRPNLDSQENWDLACDLYFLAMSYHRLGETARARDCYDWAVRWPREHPKLSTGHLEELTRFRAEAAELLGIDKSNK